MGPSEIDGPDGPLHRIPLVQATVDDGTLQLREMGTAEWLNGSFIQKVYGVPPDQLKSFRISGNAMEGTINPGERVRGVLWQGDSLNDGAIYLLHAPTGIIIRRLRLAPDTLRLTASNPDVSDQEVSQSDWQTHYRPLARIVEVMRSL